MGGGAMNIDFPMIQIRPSSANPPYFPSSSSSANFTAVPLKQSWTASSSTHHAGTRKKVESVDRTEDKKAIGSSDISVFGAVPSKFEVENAIVALQNFMHGTSWSGPVLECCDLRTLISRGFGRVYDTFRLLQTDPQVKRLVVSLASDKAIWDAVMNNEMVKKLQESPHVGENGEYQSIEEEPNLGTEILRWILNITKTKIMELIGKFLVLMNEVLRPADRKKKSTEETGVEFEDEVKSSLLLTVVILLIVIAARVHKA